MDTILNEDAEVLGDALKEGYKARFKKVAVVGFGYVGTVLSVFLAERGFKVFAVEKQVDVVRKVVSGVPHLKEPGVFEPLQEFLRKGVLNVGGSYSCVSEADAILITVGTPLGENFAPNLEAVERTVEDISKHLHSGQLIVLKSTVSPGTTRSLVASMLKQKGIEPGRDVFLAYSPERLAEGNAMNEVRSLPVVVGGYDGASTEMAASFWESAGLRVVRLKSLEAAELTKLADNVWIDVNVALTNELARICESMDVDAMDVIAAANTLPKGGGHVNFLVPGIGVGGSCLTKDPWFLVSLANAKGVTVRIPQVARMVNDDVPAQIVRTVASALRAKGHVRDSKVAVLGYAFKGGTSDVRGTPVRRIVSGFLELGFAAAVYDPWVDAETIMGECRAKVCGTLRECLSEAAALFVAVGHPEFRSLSAEELKKFVRSDCVVYDGGRIFSPKEILDSGFDYYSPGYFAYKK
jgi:nucleotide sugar dehydrogenase